MSGDAQVKPYSKKELSVLYNVSVKTLNRWIERNQKLMTDMEQAGYNPAGKMTLTARQVALIFEYLGTPNHKV
jgi:transposase